MFVCERPVTRNVKQVSHLRLVKSLNPILSYAQPPPIISLKMYTIEDRVYLLMQILFITLFGMIHLQEEEEEEEEECRH